MYCAGFMHAPVGKHVRALVVFGLWRAQFLDKLTSLADHKGESGGG